MNPIATLFQTIYTQITASIVPIGIASFGFLCAMLAIRAFAPHWAERHNGAWWGLLLGVPGVFWAPVIIGWLATLR